MMSLASLMSHYYHYYHNHSHYYAFEVISAMDFPPRPLAPWPHFPPHGDPEPLWCQFCHMEINGHWVWRWHIRGDRHQRRLRRYVNKECLHHFVDMRNLFLFLSIWSVCVFVHETRFLKFNRWKRVAGNSNNIQRRERELHSLGREVADLCYLLEHLHLWGQHYFMQPLVESTQMCNIINTNCLTPNTKAEFGIHMPTEIVLDVNYAT